MQEERIKVNISNDGEVTLDVEGVKGKQCLDLTKGLEEALGIVTKRDAKREMHERPARVVTTGVQGIRRR